MGEAEACGAEVYLADYRLRIVRATAHKAARSVMFLQELRLDRTADL